MNTPTLVGSLIFALVLLIVVSWLIQSMMRGWRNRAARQAELVGALPPVPDTVGAVSAPSLRGVYVGCTLSPRWHDRVVVGDLGYRTRAVITGYPEGIMVQRSGARPIWIPREQLIAIRTERGMVGKAMSHDGILAIRWRLPTGTEIDTGFRADNRDSYPQWIEEAQ
ncbi:transporter [Mycobacterium koreense]|uniref:Transporter n=1 Tax=Mycolicibacillus koreensis TaxID=1069220 RepID=A0A7I7SBZ7_9MYCO|nr:transporter [Mycolicibacillus koreensis]MCV7248982.1 transporter [Mycolicibacillus koreensis]OSC34518.1 transporter [Mycolicibacillus koreensis]BBY53829.1 transporter [Mycolicibacillus koreensis]